MILNFKCVTIILVKNIPYKRALHYMNFSSAKDISIKAHQKFDKKICTLNKN